MARPRHRSNLPHPAVRREANQTRGEAAQLSQGAGDLIPACLLLMARFLIWVVRGIAIGVIILA